MFANSKLIVSNQTGVHEKLAETVAKHLRHESQRPFAPHTLEAFSLAQDFVIAAGGGKPLIIDACCGKAQSTMHIAKTHSEYLVIGIDQSIHRLDKSQALPSNALLVQGDLEDFYRLAVNAGWRLAKHFILYPNPWPKSAHLKRRWHGMACFKQIVQLGGMLELRSNWDIYVAEFVEALAIAGFSCEMQPFYPIEPMTAFEHKFMASQHEFFKLRCELE